MTKKKAYFFASQICFPNQLFKFREMFEKRFHASVGVSDLYKMKEIVLIAEDDDPSSNSGGGGGGRMVQLHPALLAHQQMMQLQQMPAHHQGQHNFCGGARCVQAAKAM